MDIVSRVCAADGEPKLLDEQILFVCDPGMMRASGFNRGTTQISYFGV